MGLQAMSGDDVLLLGLEVIQNDDYKWSSVNDREEAVPALAGSGKGDTMKMLALVVLLMLLSAGTTQAVDGTDWMKLLHGERVSYLNGVIEGWYEIFGLLNTEDWINQGSTGPPPPLRRIVLCIQELSKEEIRFSVERYLHYNPRAWERPMGMITWDALVITCSP